MLKMTEQTAVNKSQSPRRKDLPFLKRNFQGTPEYYNVKRESHSGTP